MSKTRSTSPRIPFVSVVGYFKEPLANTAKLLWSLATFTQTILGDQRVKYAFTDVRSEEEWKHGLDPNRYRPVQCEDDICSKAVYSQIEKMAVPDVHVLWAPSDFNPVRKPNRDEWGWELAYEPRPIDFGTRMPCSLRWSLNLDWLPPEQRDDCSTTVANVFKLVAQYASLSSGFAEIADISETNGGSAYGGTRISWICPIRAMERYRWVMAGEKNLSMVTRVRWANLFGAQMLEKMGGPKPALDDYILLEDKPVPNRIERLKAAGASESAIAKLQRRRADENLVHFLEGGSALVFLTHAAQVFIHPFNGVPDSVQKRQSLLHAKLLAGGLIA